jgi:hypothetical protein
VQPFNRRRFIVIGLSDNEGNGLREIFLLHGGLQFFALQVMQVMQVMQVLWQRHCTRVLYNCVYKLYNYHCF